MWLYQRIEAPGHPPSASWLPNYNNSQNQYLQGWNGVAYDPGGNGNLLNDTFNSYTWDVYGDMASANGVTATYDAFGRMVELANGPQRALAQLVYSPADGSVLAETSAQGLVQAFAQLPGGGYALYVSSSNVYYYSHPDWLGSTRLLSTPSRGPIPTMAYAPFGEGYAGGLAGYVTFTSGGYAFTVNPGENQGSGLDDFMFRRYSPGQSRWISPDPAGLAAVDPSNPQTWNRYAYVANNPLSFVDPLGLQLCAPWCGGCTIDGCGSNLSGGGAPGGGWWFVDWTCGSEGSGCGGPAFYFGNGGCSNYVMSNCGFSPCGLSPYQACGGGGAANNGIVSQQPKMAGPQPLKWWEKTGLVLACIAGMDPEFAAPIGPGSQPSDSTDSTNTTEGQGPPLGPNKGGRSVPYGGSPEVPSGAAGGAAYGAGVGQCITNVFTAWPK